jgi:hypothetical protein
MESDLVSLPEWLNTRAMAKALAIHPVTLLKLKLSGRFTENRHFRKLDPSKSRSHLRWNTRRTLERMRRI